MQLQQVHKDIYIYVCVYLNYHIIPYQPPTTIISLSHTLLRYSLVLFHAKGPHDQTKMFDDFRIFGALRLLLGTKAVTVMSVRVAS